MLDPKKILNTIKKAIAAVRATKGRAGRVIRPRGVKEILVAGDLHGRVDRLKEIVNLANLGSNPGRILVLQELIHGDSEYDDGSDSSHQALDLAAVLKCQFPEQMHYLLGNHEMAQGASRLISKNGKSLNHQFDLGVSRAYGEHAEDFLVAYKQLVESLPALILLENGVCVSHGLPGPEALHTFELSRLEAEPPPVGEDLPGGSLYSLVWGRVTSEENTQAFLEKIGAGWLVIGHIPCEEGFHFANPKLVYLDAHMKNAGYVLLPADRQVTSEEFTTSAQLL
ncbi:MAG: hypothetical protein EXR99_14510 [Gemmataceae bacterium]|nr:hypothetical protein [Gemmataceae bacterium]